MSVLHDVKHTAADNAARTVILATLRETAWNVRAAARALRVDDNNLRRELRRLGIRRPQEARAA
jgi:transcriptional regulator with GAF, ATPase, and Fis domain